MPEDEEEEVEQGVEADTNIGLYAIGAVFAFSIILGFWYEAHSVAYQGLTLIQDILGLPEAILNGFSSLITAFFHWLSGLLP